MRPVPVLAAFALGALVLAGCQTTGPAKPSSTAISGDCPAWIEAPGPDYYTGRFSPHLNDTHYVNPLGSDTRQSFQGYPLDIIQLDFTWAPNDKGQLRPYGIFVQDGEVTAHFVRTRDNQPVQAFRLGEDDPGLGRPSWSWGPGSDTNFTVQLNLAPRFSPADPAMVNATWDLRRDLDGNPATESSADILYRIHYLYRTCNADGSRAQA